MTLKRIDSSQFAEGMIIHFYGARFILSNVKVHYHADSITRRNYNMERPVYTALGVCIENPERIGKEWRFQGNSLAVWFAEYS